MIFLSGLPSLYCFILALAVSAGQTHSMPSENPVAVDSTRIICQRRRIGMRFGDLCASRIESRAEKVAIALKDIGTDNEAIRTGPHARQVTTVNGARIALCPGVSMSAKGRCCRKKPFD
jgi:hypothetical protein